MGFVYPISNFLQQITLRSFADWKVMGRENVPPMGPLIIVANHQSNFDPALLAPSIPRRLRFLAKESIFNGGPLSKWFLREWGAFPINRDRADIQAYRWTLNQLQRDQAVVMFPEGTRNPVGMKKAHYGVVKLALASQAPLLPVGITGSERMGTWMRVFNPTGQLRVNIGTVFSIPPIEGKPNRDLLNSITDMIMERIAILLPDRYRGVYPVTPRKTVAYKEIEQDFEKCGPSLT